MKRLLDIVRRCDVASFALILAFFVLIAAHLPFWTPTSVLNSHDEGYISAFAWRMVEGHWLAYVDAVSLRGPLTYYLAAISTWIFGPGTYLAIRVLGFLVLAAIPWFIYRACALAGYRTAGGVAALAYAYVTCFTFPLPDGLAYNGENVLNFFALAALAVLVRALTPSGMHLGHLFAAGMLAVGAPMSKQVGIVIIPSLTLWVFLAAFSRPSIPRKRRIDAVAAFACGGITPVVLILLVYTAVGELDTLIYYTYQYGKEHYIAPFTPRMIREHYASYARANGFELAIGLAVVTWLLLMRLWGETRTLMTRYDQNGFVCTVAIGAVASVIGSKMGVRTFPHYYMQVVPWFALVGGLVYEEVLRRWLSSSQDNQARRWMFFAPLSSMVIVQLFAMSVEYRTYFREKGAPWWINPYTDPICKVVHQHSKDGDTMFVWGFEPWHYIDCHRKPATRFVYSTFLDGFVPWFFKESAETEATRVVPHSRAIFVEEMEESQPSVILEAPIEWRTINNHVDLWVYIVGRYCWIGNHHGRNVYVRRLADGRCPKGAVEGAYPLRKQPPAPKTKKTKKTKKNKTTKTNKKKNKPLPEQQTTAAGKLTEPSAH